MESLKTALDLFLHLDEHLRAVIDYCGVWTYAVLFLIVFCETGLVVTPFLPGDSLLFAAGAFAAFAPESLHIGLLLVLLSIAAILGDTLNYWLGRWVGPRAFSGKIRFLKREHLFKTQLFYEKYGGKTIIIARFVPIVRTFAPFVAGIGQMNYRQFLYYNVVGGIAWVGICAGAGYAFGNIPWVKEHFEFLVLGIIGVSLLPLAWEYFAARRHRSLPLNDVSAAPEDPLLTSARREMRITLGLWATAMAYTLGVCLTWGYGREPETLTFVLGFPDWVFWGIVVPWAACTVVASIFAMGFMQDGSIEHDPPPDEPFSDPPST